MAVTLLDDWVSVQSGTSSTVDLPLGSNWQPGDLRLFALSTSQSRSYETPAGWTELYSSSASSGTNAPGNRTVAFLARELVAGDDDPTVTVAGPAGPNVANVGVTLRGADNAAILAATPTLGYGSGSRNVVAPSIATGAGELLTTHWVTRLDQTANQGSWGVPPGMDLVASALSDGNMGYNALAASETRTSGTSGTRTAQAGSAGDWTAASLFLPAIESEIDKDGSDTGQGSESGSVTAELFGGDTGQGSESGFIAVPRYGTDAGQGSESGYVDPVIGYGDDLGHGSEGTALIAADTTGGDTGQGSEGTAEIAADTTGGDTGTGADGYGHIMLPGGDEGLGTAELDRLDADTVGGDSGHGAEGGYVETRYGDLVISFYGVDPDDGHLVPLPDFTTLSMSPQRNGPGTISLDYPATGLNFGWLYDRTVGDDADLEVEVWNYGNVTGAIRGYLQEASGHDVGDGAIVWTFAGRTLELRIAEARVEPQPLTGEITLGEPVTVPLGSVTQAQWDRLLSLGYTGTAGDSEEQITGVPQKVLDAVKANATSIPVLADPKRELKFANASPGDILVTLLTQARARGTLTDIVTDVDGTHDSDGNAWPELITTVYSPSTRYDQILDKLTGDGRIEWALLWTGSEKVLKAWVAGKRGVDRTVGLRPVVLRAGRNIVQSPRKWSVKDSVTTMFAAGSEGWYATASDLDARTRRGRAIEGATSSNSLMSADAVTAYAQHQLAVAVDGTLEIDHSLGFLPGEPRPLIAFDIGDWVYSQTGTELERYRVVQWSLTVDAQRNQTGIVVLNDAHTDAVVRQRQQLDALTSGDTVVGTSTNPRDTGVPSAPEGLVVGSAAFSDGPDAYAVVSAGWAPVTTNTDGTTATDIDGYRVEWTRYSNPDAWVPAGTTPTTQLQFTTITGLPILVRVACYDRSGNQSEWTELVAPHTTESDVTPPGVPSTLSGANYLGLVAWTWDGLTVDGADMYLAHPDFAHAQLHMSTTSDFTPDPTTQMGKVFGAGTYTYATTADGSPLTYGTSYFAKLVAVDLRDNISEPSGQGSAVPGQLVNLDLGPDAVDRANIREAAIGSAQIEELAVNDAHIMNMNVGKLTAGIMEASMIMGTGAIISGDPDGYHVRTDSSGIRLFGADGTTVTTRFLSSDGSALVSGEYRSAQSGERFVINPGGANPDEIRFYPSSTNQFGNMQVVTSTSEIFGPQPGVQLTAHSGRQDGATGILQVFPDYASLAWGPMYVQTVPHQIGLRAPRFHIGMPRGSGFALSPAEDEIMRIGVSNNSTGLFIDKTVIEYSLDGSDQPSWKCRTLDIGLSFRSGYLAVINGPGNAWREIRASAFVPTSSLRATKQDFADITYDGGALGALRRAPVQMWRRIAEVSEYGDQAATHIGPMADDLPDEVVRRADDGVTGYALDSLVGLVQAAVVQLADQQDDIADRLERMEAAR